MKMVTFLVVAVATACVFSACKKEKGSENEIDPAHVQKAEEFKTFVQSKMFQIAEYYSDKPIDYIEDDAETRSETDLWRYVSPWLKDDQNVFDVSTGKVSITQNAVKIPGNNSDVIVKDFNIGADKDGAYFNFLSHEYEPLKYRLVEFANDQFVVYADWHSGEKVYTRFHVVTP
jgi:hypothetical protein